MKRNGLQPGLPVLIMVLIMVLMVASGLAQAASNVYVTGSIEASESHGSFGLTLAGGEGHLSAQNEAGDQIFVFADAPRVLKVYEDGPADGILRTGDVILTIDGLPITDEDAGWLLQQPLDGRTYEITVRRGDSERTVELTAGPRDNQRVNDNTIEVVTYDDDGNIHVVSYSLNENGDVTWLSERESNRGGARTRSWFGLGLETGHIVVKRKGEDKTYIYFDELPQVYSVDPDGPAFIAGIQRGDVIVKVDGLRLDEDAGAEHWSLIQPGDDVELLYMRDGEIYTVQMEAEDHPTWTVDRRGQRLIHIQNSATAEEGHLRYAGTLGDVDVEVRGLSEVSIAKSGDELRIATGDFTVLLSLKED
jgi:C-terminal processing protease CtpA/Prc